MIRIALIASFFLAAFGYGPVGHDSAPPPRAETAAATQHFPTDAEIRAILEERINSGASAGIVVGMLDADGNRRYVAHGDPGPGARPLGPESVFEIGSVTKVFTGILLADMELRGELRADDPVAGFLPEEVSMPSRDGVEITLAHLSTHRSGLPRMPGNFAPADNANPFADYSFRQLYAFLSRYPLPRAVGAEFEYSNLGSGLLGHVLARHAGSDYASIVRERILSPLGMSMSGIALTSEMSDWLALGHDAAGNVTANWDIPTLAGAGALRSNAEDMLSFLEANVGEPTTPLQEAMRRSHQSRAPAGGQRVGLNWFLQDVGDDVIVWHNGGTGGYRAFAGFDPAAEVAVVVLTNSGGAGADDIGYHLINSEVPLAAPTRPEERTEVEVSAFVLAEYVGIYELAPEFQISVTLEEDQLYAQATGQQRFPVFPESETDFFLRVVDAQITFVRSSSGEVTELILHQNGANQRASKIR